jgi:hypothetical protein
MPYIQRSKDRITGYLFSETCKKEVYKPEGSTPTFLSTKRKRVDTHPRIV